MAAWSCATPTRPAWPRSSASSPKTRRSARRWSRPVAPGPPSSPPTASRRRWAALRRQVHADIRIYQDRQSAVNEQVLAALLKLEREIDPTETGSSGAALWAAIFALQARLVEVEARAARAEVRFDHLQGELTR